MSTVVDVSPVRGRLAAADMLPLGRIRIDGGTQARSTIDVYAPGRTDRGAAMSDYAVFLSAKRASAPASGFALDLAALHPSLFPFQRDVVTWACQRGRAAQYLAGIIGCDVEHL